jgi:hypothetical protein
LFVGLVEKLGEQKVTELKPGMERNWVDDVRDGFGNLFGGKKE